MDIEIVLSKIRRRYNNVKIDDDSLKELINDIFVEIQYEVKPFKYINAFTFIKDLYVYYLKTEVNMNIRNRRAFDVNSSDTSYKTDNQILKELYDEQLVYPELIVLDDSFNGECIDIIDVGDSQLYSIVNEYNRLTSDGALFFDKDWIRDNNVQDGDKFVIVSNVVMYDISDAPTDLYHRIENALIYGVLSILHEKIGSQERMQYGNIYYQRYFKAKQILKSNFPDNITVFKEMPNRQGINNVII